MKAVNFFFQLSRPLSAILFYTIIVGILSSYNSSQNSFNLVLNGNFTQISNCINFSIDSLNGVKYWHNATKGPCLFFHSCNGSIPKNYFGEQQPHSGNGYIGLVTYNLEHPDARMYITTSLKKPLIKGVNYVVRFYLSLAENSNIAQNNIGIFFTRESIRIPNQWSILDYEPQIKSDFIIKNKDEWTLVADTITSIGGESEIIIGAFGPNEIISIDIINETTKEGYNNVAMYYLDNIEVNEIK